MLEQPLKFSYMWIDQNINSVENVQLLQILQLLNMPLIQGFIDLQSLSAAIVKQKGINKNRKVVLICSSITVKKVIEKQIFKHSNVYNKVIIFCHNKQAARQSYKGYENYVHEPVCSDNELTTVARNLQLDFEQKEYNSDKNLSTTQLYAKIRKKRGDVPSKTSQNEKKEEEPSNKQSQSSQKKQKSEKKEEAKKKKQGAKGRKQMKKEITPKKKSYRESNAIWLDSNVDDEANQQMISYLKKQLNIIIETFKQYEQFSNFVDNQSQREFTLIFTPQSIKQMEKDSNMPYQQINEYILYPEPGEQNYEQLSKIDTPQIVSQQQELFKKLKEIVTGKNEKIEEKPPKDEQKQSEEQYMFCEKAIWIASNISTKKKKIKDLQKKVQMKIETFSEYQKYQEFVENTDEKCFMLIFQKEFYDHIQNDPSGPSEKIQDYVLYNENEGEAINLTLSMSQINECKHCQNQQGLIKHLQKYREYRKQMI